MTEENDRLLKGRRMLAQVDGNAAADTLSQLADIAPDVPKLIQEFAFGDIYTRSGLDLKQREMITITALLVQGDTAGQLQVHIQGALHVGLTQEEIVETFIQCIPYIGFPRVLNALSVARQVFTNNDDQNE
ncbi:MAG: carboxymuconolactone decarboxylase family protein [Schleiferilactobacillus perolens]|uniref:carboxymuconolactone decarboxylase family protein n=1 Tax=Schleiferilactobacillus perolens TaxID=100468 RepID=UPI0039ED01FD